MSNVLNDSLSNGIDAFPAPTEYSDDQLVAIEKQPIYAEYLPKAGLYALPAGASTANGWMLCKFVCTTLPTLTASQYAMTINDGTSNNQLGIRLLAGGSPAYRFPNVQMVHRVATVSKTSCNDALPAKENSVLTAMYVWRADGYGYAIINGTYEVDTLYPEARSWTPTNMRIGQRNGGSDPLVGRVLYAELGNTYLTPEQAAARLNLSNPKIVVATAGQSNIQNWKDGAETEAPFGHNAFLAGFGTLATANNPSEIRLIHGAEGGSSIFSEIQDENWMVNDTTPGPELLQFYDIVNKQGKQPDFIIWDQGESEEHFIDDPGSTYSWLTKAVYKERLRNLFLHMKRTYPNTKILINILGIRGPTTYDNSYAGLQKVVEVQKELIAEYNWIDFCAERYDLALTTDEIHETDASYAISGERAALRVAALMGYPVTGTLGPRLTSATRVTNVITATITHDGGTDFIPTTDIEGFYYKKADGTVIAVSSAAQASATTITVTLASDPDGAGTLYYMYDNPTITALTNLVHDNHAKAYPLQRGFVSVA